MYKCVSRKVVDGYVDLCCVNYRHYFIRYECALNRILYRLPITFLTRDRARSVFDRIITKGSVDPTRWINLTNSKSI